MIKNLFEKLSFRIDILKIFSFTSLSTIAKMIAGIVSVKVVAVILGPSGVALLGQLNNFTAIVLAIATLGIQTGVTKIVAQLKETKNKLSDYIVFATISITFCSLLCGFGLIVFSNFLTERILQSEHYSYVFIIFGITLVFYALNILLLAIINGFKDFKLYVLLSIISSFVGLLLSLSLVYFYKIPGAFINTVTSQSFVFIINVFILKFFCKFDFSIIHPTKKLISYLKKEIACFYTKYMFMTLIPSIMLPFMQLLIRTFIINNLSIEAAGWWEGINKISNMYLSVISTALSVYYVPRYAELQTEKELKKEIQDAYKIIYPLLCAGLILVYILKHFIIAILFSSQFLEMEKLFLFQLIGDFFKMSSWVLSFMMSAKLMLKESVFSEIIFDMTYILLTFLCIKFFGIQGTVIGYMINYILYSVCMYFVVYKRIKIVARQ